MLKEIKTSKNRENNYIKRWFNDDVMDLIVWAHEDGSIYKFQLCYDKTQAEHALTWIENSGFLHNKIDDGEDRSGKHKRSPILLPDGTNTPDAIADKFKRNSSDIDINIMNFVYKKILESAI